MLVSLFVAVVFAIAATPGSMAVAPAHSSAMTSQMADCGMAMADHQIAPAKPMPHPNKPCTNVAGCLGLLACYGMAALPSAHFQFGPVAGASTSVAAQQRAVGLTVAPEHRPPIA